MKTREQIFEARAEVKAKLRTLEGRRAPHKQLKAVLNAFNWVLDNEVDDLDDQDIEAATDPTDPK